LGASVLIGILVHGSLKAQVILPSGDITKIKSNGIDVMMLSTVIDLNNSHPIGTISFFKHNSSGAAEHLAFEVDDDYRPFLPLLSGADCATSGVKVFHYGSVLRVAYATRKGSWSDKKGVTVQVFELTGNPEQAPGTPSLYFKEKKVFVTRKSYCDVNRALADEIPDLLKVSK